LHLRPVIKASRLIPRPCVQSAAQLPEAFVVLGFAFYLQPMMMPLLHDMPPGPAGLAITSTAVKIVIIGGLLTVQLSLCSSSLCIWSMFRVLLCSLVLCSLFLRSFGTVQLVTVQLVTVQLVLCTCSWEEVHVCGMLQEGQQ